MLTDDQRAELRALNAEAERAELADIRAGMAALDAEYPEPVLVGCRCVQCSRPFAAVEREPFCSGECVDAWNGAAVEVATGGESQFPW